MCVCVGWVVGGLEVGVVFGWRPAELYMQRHIHVYIYHTPAGVRMQDGAHPRMQFKVTHLFFLPSLMQQNGTEIVESGCRELKTSSSMREAQTDYR